MLFEVVGDNTKDLGISCPADTAMIAVAAQKASDGSCDVVVIHGEGTLLILLMLLADGTTILLTSEEFVVLD